MTTKCARPFHCISIVFAIITALGLTPTALAAQSITATPSTIGTGGTISVTVANGPGNANDWVGLVAAGDPDSNYIAWQFLNGTTTLPETGVASATLQFAAPASPGTFTARLFANGGWTRLAISSPVNVTDDTTAPTVAISSPAGGATVVGEVTVTATANDHIGIASVEFRLDGAPLGADATAPYTVSWNTMTASDGPHTLTAVARDAADNQTSSAAANVIVANSSTPPVISNIAVSSITVSGATITWTTNEVSDSQVNYGPTTVYGSSSPLDGSLVTAHTMTLSGLSGDALYHVRVRSRDAAGHLATSGDITFTTLDATPPVISDVLASSITVSGATITWTTNETGDSRVNFGLTTVYGSNSALNASQVTSHSVVLAGRAANTTYHYRVRSRDAAGNLALSGDFTFTTLGDATDPAVVISAPAGGTTVSGSVPVTVTASDAGGVAGVQFRLDGAPLGPEDVAAPYATTWNTRGSTDLIFGVTKVIVWPMTMTAGSGFTKRLSLTCPSCAGEDMVSEDKIQTASGPVQATWTFSVPAHYLAQMAAFKATGTPAYVQGAVAASNSPSTTAAQTFGANVTAGNLLVVAVAWSGNSAVTAVDTRGNTYAVATSAYDAVNGQSLAILYAANVSGGATTVTASFGGTAADVQRLQIHEYSGVATTNPLDGTTENSADATATANAVVSGLATTTVVPPVADGSHTLTAVARDAAGNTTTSAAVTVTVANAGDTTPPTITGVAATAITSSGATIGWTTNQTSNSQVDYGLTTGYGTSTILNGSLVTAHTVPVSGLTINSVYHYRVRSRDAAGNLALSGDFTFTTLGDVTDPTVVISAPAGGSTVGGAITVSATASDNVGVGGVQFRLDGAPLGPEDVAAPYATTWNTRGSTDLIFGVTKVIVWPMTMTAGSGFTKRLSLTCPSCAGEDMVSEDKIQTASGPVQATWTFSVPAHYLAQMAAFKATGTPAYVQGAVAASNSPSTTAAQTFGANVTAGNLLVVAVAWSGNSAVTAVDTRGNTYAVATSAYDAVNGQSLAILYAANVSGGATTVTASFGGTVADVQRLQIHEYSGVATTNPLDATAENSADGTAAANAVVSGSAATTVVPPAANGPHTLTAVARDAAGNTTTSAAVTVTVANAGDTTPPAITGVTATSITASGATIRWTTNEASDSQVNYGLTTAYGSTSPLNASLVTAHSVILGALTGNTTYHVRARSEDAAGNLALSADFAFTTLTVDQSSPVVSITSPAANATVSGTVTFSATASDDVGVVGVEFKRGGVNVAPEDTVAPYTVAWDTRLTASGVQTLTAVAWDAAGNQTTATRTVTVSNAAAQVRLTWNANSESDLAGYRVYFGTSSGTYSSNVNVGNVTTYTVTGLQAGTLYYFAVTASDSAGSESGDSNEVSGNAP